MLALALVGVVKEDLNRLRKGVLEAEEAVVRSEEGLLNLRLGLVVTAGECLVVLRVTRVVCSRVAGGEGVEVELVRFLLRK